jgi:hypothetical protein
MTGRRALVHLRRPAVQRRAVVAGARAWASCLAARAAAAGGLRRTPACRRGHGLRRCPHRAAGLPQTAEPRPQDVVRESARWLGAGRPAGAWLRRRRQFWFVIKEGCLYWYTNESESEYKGVLPLMSACS